MKRLLMVFVLFFMFYCQAWGAYEKSGIVYYPTDGTSAAALLVGIEAKGTPCTMKFIHTSGVSTPYIFSSGVAFPEYVTLEFEDGAILVLDVGGGSYITIKGSIKAGPLQQIFEEISGEVLISSPHIVTFWPHWLGIDGSDDQVEINRAIEISHNASIKCLIPWSSGIIANSNRYDISDSVYIPAGHNYVAMSDVGPGEYVSTGRPGLFEWSGGTTTPNAIIKVGRQLESYISGICASASAIGDTDQGENIAGWLFYNENDSVGSIYGRSIFEKITAKSCDYGFLLGNADTLAIPDDSNGNWYGGYSDYTSPDTQTNFNHCIWRSLSTFDCANAIVYDTDNSDNSWIDGAVLGGTGQRTAARNHEIWIKQSGNQFTMNKLMMSGFRIPDDNAVIRIDDGDGIITDVNMESGEADATTDLASTTTYWDITNPSGTTFRYAYASGDDPGNIAALTTPSAAWATPYITLTGDTADPDNVGGFEIIASGTTWFEISNVSGVVESGIQFDHMYYLDPKYRRAIELNAATAGRGQWTLSNIRFVNFRDEDGYAIKSLFRGGVSLDGIASSGDIAYGGPVTATSCVFENGFGFTKLGSSGFLQDIGTWYRSSGAGTSISGDPKGNLILDTIQTTDMSMRAYGHIFNKHNSTAFLTDNTTMDICTWEFDADTASCLAIDIFYSIGSMSTGANAALESGRVMVAVTQDNSNNITTNITESNATQALDGYSSLTTTWAVSSGTNTVTITLNQDNDLNNPFRGTFFATVMASTISEAESDKTKFSWAF